MCFTDFLNFLLGIFKQLAALILIALSASSFSTPDDSLRVHGETKGNNAYVFYLEEHNDCEGFNNEKAYSIDFGDGSAIESMKFLRNGKIIESGGCNATFISPEYSYADIGTYTVQVLKGDEVVAKRQTLIESSSSANKKHP